MTTDQGDLLKRITSDPKILGGKPLVRGHRLAVEHVLGMLAAGDQVSDIIAAYPCLEPLDVQACVLYAYKIVAHERVEPFTAGSAA